MTDAIAIVKELGFHDAVVTSLSVFPSDSLVEITMDDIYANFYELEGYLGPQPGCMRLEEVTSLQYKFNVPPVKRAIYDCQLNQDARSSTFELTLTFWPSGKLVVTCGRVKIMRADGKLI